MAEQAINVVYALAEHPDTVCGAIVKQLLGCILQTKDPSDSQEQGIVQGPIEPFHSQE